MGRLIAIIVVLFCMSGCSEDTLSWLCPVGAVSVDGQCEWMYSQLSAGANQTCAVRAETGEVVCWGQASGIAGWPTDVAFSQVSTGYDRTCGIVRDSGELRCWAGELELVGLPSSGSYTQVVAGGPVCAIRSDDATVQCWVSADVREHPQPPSGLAFRKIVAGAGGYCGIRRDDSQIQCWGSIDASSVPDGEVCSLSGGSSELGFCALRCSGEAVCFPDQALAGALIPSQMRFTQLEVGLDQVCGVAASDGHVTCWSSSERPAVQPPRVALEQLVLAGSHGSYNRSSFYGNIEHACALRRDDHRVVCWGDDYTGQVSGAPSFTRFAQVVSRTIPLGGHQPPETLVCGLRERDGLATCWGDDGGPARDRKYRVITTGCGILAADGRSDCLADLAPDETLREVKVSPDGLTACGIRADDHTAICWHRRDPDSNEDARVSTVPVGVPLHGLVMGHYHACALRDSDDRAVCWGDDTGATISDAPQDVAFRQLQADARYHISGRFPESLHTCGIRESDGWMQCWGAQDEYSAGRQTPAVPLQQLAGNTRRGILADTREIAWFFDDGSLEIEAQVRGVRFRAVADTFSCGIREADSHLTCWDKMIWNP